MSKYICLVCGTLYDPKVGDPNSDIPPDTDFKALPGDWMCPECGAGVDNFAENPE